MEEIQGDRISFVIEKDDTRNHIDAKIEKMQAQSKNDISLTFERNTLGPDFVKRFAGITCAKITVKPGTKLFAESLSVLSSLGKGSLTIQLSGCKNLSDIEAIDILGKEKVGSATLPSGRTLPTALAITKAYWLLGHLKNYGHLDNQPEQIGQHSSGIWRIKALSDGAFATASYDRTAKIWKLGKQKPVNVLKGHEQEVLCVEELSDGRLLTGCHDGKLRLWDHDRSTCVEMKGHEHGIYSIGTLSSHHVATGACDFPTKGHHLEKSDSKRSRWKYNICVWDLQQKKVIAELKGHGGAIPAIIGEGEQLISCSSDRTVRIWDVENQTTIQKQERHEDYVYALTRTAEGRIASGSRDNAIILWDPREKRTRVLDNHQSTVYDLAALPFNQLASASRDQTVRVWDLRKDKTALNTLQVDDRYAFCIDRLRTGELVAGLSGKNKDQACVMVWDFPDSGDNG